MLYSLILSGESNASPSTADPNYLSPIGNENSGATGSAGRRRVIAPFDGAFKNLLFAINVAPGAGKSWTITVTINGVDTGITVTISDSNTFASDLVHSAAFLAGDLIELKCTPSGTPAAMVSWSSSLLVTQVSGYTMMGGNTGSTALDGVTTMYMPLYGCTGGGRTTERPAGEIVMPTSGQLFSLYVKLEVAPGVGASRTFMIRQNEADTTLTLTISGTNTAGSLTSVFVAVNAGDRFSLQEIPSGSPAASRVSFGVAFQSSSPLYFLMAATDSNNWGQSDGNQDIGLTGGDVTHGSSQETQWKRVCDAMTVKNMFVDLGAAPGAGKSYTVHLHKNEVDTALVTAVADSATANSGTADVVVSSGDFLCILPIPSGTPGLTGGALVSFLCQIDTPSSSSSSCRSSSSSSCSSSSSSCRSSSSSSSCRSSSSSSCRSSSSSSSSSIASSSSSSCRSSSSSSSCRSSSSSSCCRSSSSSSSSRSSSSSSCRSSSSSSSRSSSSSSSSWSSSSSSSCRSSSSSSSSSCQSSSSSSSSSSFRSSSSSSWSSSSSSCRSSSSSSSSRSSSSSSSSRSSSSSSCRSSSSSSSSSSSCRSSSSSSSSSCRSSSSSSSSSSRSSSSSSSSRSSSSSSSSSCRSSSSCSSSSSSCRSSSCSSSCSSSSSSCRSSSSSSCRSSSSSSSRSSSSSSCRSSSSSSSCRSSSSSSSSSNTVAGVRPIIVRDTSRDLSQ